MTASAAFDYDRLVSAARPGARQWIGAGVLLVCAVLTSTRVAAAKTTAYDVADQAVLQVVVRSAAVTIRVWNRNTIEVDTPNDSDFVQSRRYHPTGQRFFIPLKSVEEQRFPESPIIVTLLPEDFPAPKLAPGDHDIVRVEEPARPRDAGGSRSELTVTIPQTAGLVNVRSRDGDVALHGYHGTTIASVVHGRVAFDDVGGDAFVQALDGAFYATDSTFDRLRIRSNSADEVFDACRVKEIEATTLTGDILFDNGIFEPGLARFVSDRGAIGLGFSGGAQVGAHSDAGQIRSMLPHAPPSSLLDGRDRDDLRLAGDGGPLVNASTVRGDVFLYDGSLANRQPATLGPAWQPMADLLQSSRDAARTPRKRRIP